jgi:hypothetical protein
MYRRQNLISCFSRFLVGHCVVLHVCVSLRVPINPTDKRPRIATGVAKKGREPLLIVAKVRAPVPWAAATVVEPHDIDVFAD